MISNESECGVVHSSATAIGREDAETRSDQVNHSRGVMSLGLRTRRQGEISDEPQDLALTIGPSLRTLHTKAAEYKPSPGNFTADLLSRRNSEWPKLQQPPFFLLHTFSDRGVWEVHRQLTGLVPLYPGGVSGSVNIYLSSLQ